MRHTIVEEVFQSATEPLFDLLDGSSDFLHDSLDLRAMLACLGSERLPGDRLERFGQAAILPKSVTV